MASLQENKEINRRPYLHRNCISASLQQARGRKRKLPGNRQFAASILALKKLLLPKMILSSDALHEMDDFLAHFLETFDSNLRILCRKKRPKTLTVHDLECATKFCLPPLIHECVIEYGKDAVKVVLLKDKVK